MADKFLTLLDITKQTGTDQAVGVVEEVRTFAPEAATLLGRPIAGTTYKTLKRTLLPAGPTFRKANQGSDILSSTWDQVIQQCFYLDGQMSTDEAVLSASEFGEDYVLANEAVGVLKQKLITLGSQFYYGNPSDTDAGFRGLQYLYDTTNCQQKAGGSASNIQTSAYFVCNGLEYTSFIFGKNMGIQMNAWLRQQVKDNNGKYYFAKVNNLAGWIGLSFNYSKSVVRVCNIDNISTTTLPLTDAIGAKALASFPVGVVPNFCFMNRPTRLGLQISRSAIIGAITANEPLRFAPTPAEIGGIPIVVTDSLINTEAVVS
jgi:hypothetical protein